MTPTRNRKVPKHKSRNKLWLVIGIIAIVIIVVGLYSIISQPNNEYSASSTKVLLHTSMGDITVELRNDMPITAGNFKSLVQSGTYNGTIFHRVIAGFMIQGGDPTGTGHGDPSIPNIKDEFTSDNHNVRGTIAMANTGQPNSGSSQFFINVVDNSNRYASFDSSYPVFGKVVSGMDVVDKIAAVQTDVNDRPLQNVTVVSATVLP
jgi:peptidylprolyl isomerase